MPLIPLAEGRHHCSVLCDKADQRSTARYLSQPKRPMAALLNRQRLDLQANGSFLYRSRPFQVLRYEIRPEVGFTANWSEAESALRIVFQHNRIQGLGSLERAIQFSCEALIRPCSQGFEASARASILMAEDHPLSVVPLPLRSRLADQALSLVFRRLERRCQGGLRRSIGRWTAVNAQVENNASNRGKVD